MLLDGLYNFLRDRRRIEPRADWGPHQRRHFGRARKGKILGEPQIDTINAIWRLGQEARREPRKIIYDVSSDFLLQRRPLIQVNPQIGLDFDHAEFHHLGTRQNG